MSYNPHTAWNDINMPANALTLGAAAPDSITLFGSGGIKGLGFNGNATEESVHGAAELLHGYIEGTNIDFHVHWMPTTADAGNVKWQLEYSWMNMDGTFSAPTTISVVIAAGGTAWVHKVTDIGEISGAGKEIISAFVFRLFRDPADEDDTYAADAALIQAGIHYQVDTLGSRQELIK